MAWGGGLFSGGDDGNWLIGKGEAVLDLAGGTVVHINAGIAALVACIVLGARKGFPSGDMKPHSAGLTVVGASILWVGWFGFNAGSAFTAGIDAGHAMLVTQVATATAALAWMFCEWFGKSGKPTAVGIATGAVAGLVAITPASGAVGPIGAIVVGVAAGAICYWASTSLKKSLGYDDSLDVFGVHCVGGIVGCVLTGVCSYAWIGGSGGSEAGMGTQVMVQIKSVLVTLVWSGVAAYIAIKIADVCCGGIRSSEDDETEGLDVTTHGEEGYNL
jgi:Amt family ammonium transporter